MIRVLLIEDDPPNREMLTLYLTSQGYAVTTATNGGEGLQLAAQLAPDLILLDMGLPVMDGWAMVSALRADPQLAHLLVIALTAYAMEGDREHCLAAGCNDYCSKPIDFSDLRAKIHALIQAKPEAFSR
jgi:two-component system, cell cycle response regulator DivK